jgi:mono/diheme cytochrome c family protein
MKVPPMKIPKPSSRKIVITAALAVLGIGASLVAQTGSGGARTEPRSEPAARQASAVQTAANTTAANSSADAAKHRAVLNKYCVSCHNNRSASPTEAPVNLEGAGFDDLMGRAGTWERVVRKLSVRAMPPPGMPRPTEAEYAGLTGWLSASLDRVWEAKSTPGRFVVHRLNRAEYANTVRDLLAVDIDVSDLLPTDGAEFGFDNIATSLKTSPLLLEGYLTAAQRVAAMAVGDPKVKPGMTEHSISREFSQSGYIDGLPLGTMGGTVIRHVFPADAEYKLSGRLVRGVQEGYAGVEGNETPNTFVITVDGTEVYTAPIGGPKDHELQAADLAAAQPIIDKRMTGRARITAGPHDVGFTWKERPGQLQDVWEPARRDSQEVHMIGGLPRLKTVAIDGPYNVSGVGEGPSRERLFVCHPTAKGSGVPNSATADETACATKILSNLARRAFRRPVTPADVEAPLAFYKKARQEQGGKPGGNFDDGIRAGVARVLSSPYFLYRVEQDPANARAGVAHPVTDIELASRLSFFLWSSIPDEKLLDLAAAGRLREPGALAAQVQRMLEDERANALVENFTGQWLQLRNLEAKVAPDLLMFSDFDDNIRKGFRKETEMFFGYILRQDRSALELMNADYTFVDERLARHYGIKGVYGPRFRKVKLTDPNRRGLLGHGSILSMTSVATRTSPVFRGKYVLSTFLNTPPPPPPPNVPSLEESAKGTSTEAKTVRAQLELHRANPTCASCHRVIDPPGFALENFDSVGVWHDVAADGAPLDTAGTLADGSKVNGPVALREAISSRPEAFATVLTDRMLTYALGRGLEPSDMPVVRRIVKKAAQSNYSLSSLVKGIIESAPFQMRTKLEPAESASAPADATKTEVTRVAQAGISRSKAKE